MNRLTHWIRHHQAAAHIRRESACEDFRILRLAICAIVFAVMMVACSTAANGAATTPAPQLPTPAALPTPQAQAGSLPPVVRRVVEREEVIDGFLYVYDDIYFTDPDGDAVAMTYTPVSSSLPYPLSFTDDPIEASAEEQKGEALFTVAGKCWQKLELAFESRIVDQSGNLSEPVRFTLSCSAPQPLDTTPYLITGLRIALPIALILLLGFWLLFRKRPSERLSALRSMLLMLCLLLLVKFMQLILHEGGHSLYLLVRGIPITLYVHPFDFSGFYRPQLNYSDIWTHIPGSATAIPAALLISLPFWKRRSLAVLPLVMLFPFVALNDGMNVMGFDGDFWNLVQVTGMSAIPFLVLGALIVVVGIVSWFAILPLADLEPQDRKPLFVLPAAMFLWGALSQLVALIFVPGSPIDAQYFLGREILASANSILMMTLIGAFLAVVYVTLWRRVYPKLPAWLRTEKVDLTWKDLRVPALLAVVSIVLGLIIIT
jgi:hypothetical protein